jgi:hypothetical protein
VERDGSPNAGRPVDLARSRCRRCPGTPPAGGPATSIETVSCRYFKLAQGGPMSHFFVRVEDVLIAETGDENELGWERQDAYLLRSPITAEVHRALRPKPSRSCIPSRPARLSSSRTKINVRFTYEILPKTAPFAQ